MPDIHPIQTAISNILQDHCLPQGGYLGFGLRFTYPAFNQKQYDLQSILDRLRGSDALLRNVLTTLSLSHSIQLVFDENRYDVLVPNIPDLEDMVIDSGWDQELCEYGAEEVVKWDAQRERKYADDHAHGQQAHGRRSRFEGLERIMWVTPKMELKTYENEFVGGCLQPYSWAVGGKLRRSWEEIN